jgi:hypothetical protein
MKRIAIMLGCVVGCGILVVVGLFVALGFLFRVPDPPQPAFGFTGDWRSTDVFGYEERPLPAAATVRQDYSTWQPKTEHRRRLYLARLGGSERQFRFVASTNSGDTPMGAQRYTWVEFDYTDPTNGTYHLTWMMRGEHDPSFLRFDGQYRLYQLELSGDTNDISPRLFIHAIEGIRPEHYVGD